MTTVKKINVKVLWLTIISLVFVSALISCNSKTDWNSMRNMGDMSSKQVQHVKGNIAEMGAGIAQIQLILAQNYKPGDTVKDGAKALNEAVNKKFGSRTEFIESICAYIRIYGENDRVFNDETGAYIVKYCEKWEKEKSKK